MTRDAEFWARLAALRREGTPVEIVDPKAPVRFEPCFWCGSEVTGYTPSERGVVRWPDRIAAAWPGDFAVTLVPCGHTVRSIRIYTKEP